MPDVGTIENGVLVGRDGYLFLAGGGHSVADFVTGKLQVHPLFYQIFRQNLAARADWAARHGAQYLHLIMPDKQSIIPEAWVPSPPIKLGAGYVERNPDFADSLLYPLDLLQGAKHVALSRVDTHLTAHGSVLVARHLAERFSGVSQEATFQNVIQQIDRETTITGDLGSKLTPPVRETQVGMREPPGIFLNNRLEGGNNGGVDLRFNPQAPYRKRVAIFGDSFGRDIARALQFWYGQVYFFRTGYFHAEMAELCKPDILITENVERYLDHCLDDTHRPNFLLFPYINEKPFDPPPAFAAALSAILSYPRKPYAEYITKLGFAPEMGDHAAETLLPRYDGAAMADPAEEEGVIEVLETPQRIPRHMPAFVADLSGRGLMLQAEPWQHIHGSYLVRREDVLLFGPNHVVSPAGFWSCEARSHKEQFLTYLNLDFYDKMYPGVKPRVVDKTLRTTHMQAGHVTMLDEPVFLATPLEPPIWGRWIATVAHKVMQFKQVGAGRKFLCYAALDWQKAFLLSLGLQEHEILLHDPGRSYICRDLMTVEYSATNMTVSALERANFFEIVNRLRVRIAPRPKLFVSRLSRSRDNPKYRVLRNEAELAAMLAERGFALVEPEKLPFTAQVSLFAGARDVVCVGGSALFNTVFCAPGTRVVTIESSAEYAAAHAELLASLELEYGVIFGEQDLDDPTPHHKSWTLDLPRAAEVLDRFFAGA